MQAEVEYSRRLIVTSVQSSLTPLAPFSHRCTSEEQKPSKIILQRARLFLRACSDTMPRNVFAQIFPQLARYTQIRPYIADGSASRPRKTGPTDKTHFIAIKTPSKKERHGHTPSPNPFDPKLCAGKSRQRKSKIKRRLVDSQTGRASAPPVLIDELNPETRNRSLPDLNALIRESPALSHLTTSLETESPPHLVSEQEYVARRVASTQGLLTYFYLLPIATLRGRRFPQLDTFQAVTTVPFDHSINDDGTWMPMDSEGGAIKQEPLEIATSTLGTLDDLFLFDTSISIDGTSFNP
eukprot:m.199059 g.199059  ORF g.199059 m.199059 type:complete len:296 (-) comp15309_c0_seq5:2282-3169(-)